MELPDTEKLLHSAQKSLFPCTKRENVTLKSKSTNGMCPNKKGLVVYIILKLPSVVLIYKVRL
jgi:hypothetical protein